MTQLTPVLLAAATGCTNQAAALWAEPLSKAMERFRINTPTRQAAFLAQLAHESGKFTASIENLNYSAESLMKVWPSRFPNIAVANQYARNPEKIANLVYANRMGNGDSASGDGWKYRGRGPIQITGKSNYASCGRGIGLDLVSNPDLLLQPQTAALSAAWFWADKGLNELADAGDFVSITKRINGGTIGLAERQALWERAKKAIV